MKQTPLSSKRAKKEIPAKPAGIAVQCLNALQPLFHLLARPLWWGIIVQDFVIILFSILVASQLWGENLKAKFGLIDDHEVISYLGPKSSISLNETINIFRSTEAVNPGVYNRYRPSYYFLRCTETYLWGDSPTLWYKSRLAMFVISLAIAWSILARISTLGIATFLVLFALHAPYWGLIWAVLGPSETYACFGLAIYFLGYYLCWRNGLEAGTLGWALIFVGTLISAGAKENFTLLAIPTALLLTRQFMVGQGNWKSILGSLSSVGFCLFVLNAARIGANRAKQDIYAQPVDSARLKPLLQELSFSNPLLWSTILVLLGLALLYWRDRTGTRTKTALRWAGSTMFLELVLYAVYLALLVFYNGKWQMDSRYAFPGELIHLAMFAYPVISFLKLPPIIEMPSTRFACLLLSAAAVCGVIYQGFEKNMQFAAANAMKTSSLQDLIEKSRKAALESPSTAIILYSQNLGDFEALYAVERYLRHTGMRNPIMFEMAKEFGNGSFSPEMIPQLTKTLKDMENGASVFTARNTLAEKQPCYYLGLTVTPKSERCGVIGAIR